MKLLLQRKENKSDIYFQKEFVKQLLDVSDCDNFDCGDKKLNDYMMECIKGNHATFHALYDITDGSECLAGVCFLKCSSCIEKKGYNVDNDGELDLDNPLKCELYPAVEILYFAMDKKYQDLKIVDNTIKGCLASYYLSSMIKEIINSSKNLSKVDYVLLYSVAEANKFYDTFGFEKFDVETLAFKNKKQGTCTPMYLALE